MAVRADELAFGYLLEDAPPAVPAQHIPELREVLMLGQMVPGHRRMVELSSTVRATPALLETEIPLS